MTRKMIVLFIAELAAVAVLRLIYMFRRDRLHLPRSTKVSHVNQTPVYNPSPRKQRPLEDRIRDVEIEGWTPP